MQAQCIFDSTYLSINKEKLREHIVTQDLKLYWVAEMAGIHKTTLRRWLSGHITRVREEHVMKLASVLMISPDLIIEH